MELSEGWNNKGTDGQGEASVLWRVLRCPQKLWVKNEGGLSLYM